MKSIISVAFILTFLLMPEVLVIGYLASIGDFTVVGALSAIVALPGNFVLSLLT